MCSTMELDLQLELARIQSDERVRIAQIELDRDRAQIELDRDRAQIESDERVRIAQIELDRDRAQIESDERVRIELARIESEGQHTKGWYCSICQDCSRFTNM